MILSLQESIKKAERQKGITLEEVSEKRVASDSAVGLVAKGLLRAVTQVEKKHRAQEKRAKRGRENFLRAKAPFQKIKKGLESRAALLQLNARDISSEVNHRHGNLLVQLLLGYFIC